MKNICWKFKLYNKQILYVVLSVENLRLETGLNCSQRHFTCI